MLPAFPAPRYLGEPATLAGLALRPGERYPLQDLLDALAEEARAAERRPRILKGPHQPL